MRLTLPSAGRASKLAVALTGAAFLFSPALLACAVAGPTPARAEAAPASKGFTVAYGEWADPARGGRKVPYKLYLPDGPGPFPVIVHSHGLGGSREGSTYILEAVARAGFVVVTLQHPGSDTSILGGAAQGGGAQGLLRALPPEAAENRFRDLPFALDQLAAANAGEGALKGKLDLTRIGMSGHSFGALGTLVAVGQGLPADPSGAFREPRIRAAIVYSPNKARVGDQATAFTGIATPILHFTGTEDSTPIDLEKTPWGRTIPFQRISGADQFLIVLDGGDHGVFGGRRQAAGALRPKDPEHMRLIVEETVLFWRAYLLDDGPALTALCALPRRVTPVAEGYTKATRCGPPTPIKPAE